MTATATRAHYTARAKDYAKNILSGKIVACRWVQLACQRHLEDLKRAEEPGALYYFDTKAANRVCDIVERFPHIKGIWAQNRKHIELEPWQCFIVCSVFGWKWIGTDMRRFRIAYIEVPRKNAKSTITSTVGLYLTFCDGEQGAQVVSAANTRDQAKLVFTDAQLMARKEPGFRQKFGVDVLAHSIVQESTASRFYALSAEHSNLDGLNLHAALIDELHAHPTRGLWDVLETATGSRAQPLIWAITTAGVNRASVCYDQRGHVLDILKGVTQDDTYFGIIYTRDDGDDPYEESTWVKCNPNYGISVYPETLQSEGKRAQVMPSAQPAFLMRHCNIWVTADTAWLPAGAWEKCADPALDLEDYAGEPCYFGIDLALRSDIAALMLVFPPTATREYWAVFGRYYLPEQTVNRSENTHYQGWESIGRLVGTPGAVTDFDYILDTVTDLASRVTLLEIALDPFDAGPLIATMEKAGLPKPIEIRQSAPNMSPAMVELEGLILSGKIKHDGDPVLAWMMSNVTCRRSGDLIQPKKAGDDKKIDGVTAVLMCIHRAVKQQALPPPGRGAWLITAEDE